MNHSHRDGWPPTPPSMNMQQSNEQARQQPPSSSSTFGSNLQNHQQSAQISSALPPPPSPFHPAAAAPPGPSLPGLGSITQSSSTLSGHRGSHSSHDQPMNQQSYPPPSLQPSYAMSGVAHNATSPALPALSSYDRDRELNESREREAREREAREREAREREAREREAREREAREREAREREFDHHNRRDREIRDREARDRQSREQGPPQQSQSESVQLHQPAPVGSQMRAAIHGPNGLLATPAQALSNQQAPNATVSPSGPVTLFGPPASHAEPNSRNLLQSAQVPLSSIIPFPPNHGLHQIPGTGLAQGQQPILNDALSYLDQVKVQFVSEPNVYNQFLDIMKDFKSQAIDTPGVIRRVSSLFAGNPNLIQGFNTFLPPGYRIECGTADDPNAIRVTTPMGTTVSPMGSALRPPSNPRVGLSNGLSGPTGHGFEIAGRVAENSWPQTTSTDISDNMSTSQNFRSTLAAFNSSHDATSNRDSFGQGNAAIVHQQEQRGVSQLQNAVSAATIEVTGRPTASSMLSPHESSAGHGAQTGMEVSNGLNSHQNGTPAMEKRGPVEFNHAISYVNKIKNRFSQQPEIYKQFLEILQTYQRESKPIQDVYAQVTHLFNGAPDLLEDFKQFLPESAAQAKAAAARQAAEDATMLSNVRGDAGYPSHSSQLQHTPRPEQHRLPPLGNFAPTPSAGRDGKRKRGDRHSHIVTTASFGGSDSTNLGYASKSTAVSGKRAKQQLQSQQSTQQPPGQLITRSEVSLELPPISPTLVPSLPQPMPPASTATATTDELAAFDRAKKYIGNKNTMNEFLKLCNLFSQDLIDKNLLIHRMQNFIGGNPELFQWFKDFLSYDGKDEIVENRARPVSGRVALSNCRGLGPSYRLLPKKERTKKCSGRDEICNAVLNDEWATHPTWASEESGFAVHRKNVHEEGLHRIEEERHDYDLNIGVCERTIQLLEPIAQHIRLLPDEEKLRYKLQPHLGGPSETIYKRMIMKIYGRDHGRLVIENMFSQPVNVVPIVLMRCRQKLEEWKASQREWEKVWREQTQKMFWRSLDHQGINAKMLDKRQFQPKTLQNEIHVKQEEQQRQHLTQATNVSKDQSIQQFQDAEVLVDATRLLLIHAEHTHPTDFVRLATFVREFVPLFFGLAAEAFEERILDVFEPSIHDEEMDEREHDTENTTTPRSRKYMKHDLLRNVLDRHDKAGRGKPDSGLASGSPLISPEVKPATVNADRTVASSATNSNSDNESPDALAAAKWLDHPLEGNVRNKKRNVRPNEPFGRRTYNLYANLEIFCFFRVFAILHERLYKVKMNEAEVHESVRRAKYPKAAIDLHMVDKHPSNFFDDTSASANYYEQILRMLEDNVKGELEMSQIEEVLRRYYLTSGWQLYSFDRLLGSLVRFAIGVLGNEGRSKNWDIIQLWMRDRRKESTTHEDELVHRRQAEKLIKEGDVFRISFHEEQRTARIRLLTPQDATFSINAYASDEGFLTYEQRWQHYVSSYASLPPTEGVAPGDVHLPFLKRVWGETKAASLRKTMDGEANRDAFTDSDGDDRLEQIKSKEGLILRIGIDDYKIWYSEIGSEEWWITDKRSKQFSKNGNGAELLGKSSTNASTSAETPKNNNLAGNERSERESRDIDFEEKFVMNNRWMGVLGKDKVEEAKRVYREWKEDETEVTMDKAVEDAEMS